MSPTVIDRHNLNEGLPEVRNVIRAALYEYTDGRSRKQLRNKCDGQELIVLVETYGTANERKLIFHITQLVPPNMQLFEYAIWISSEIKINFKNDRPYVGKIKLHLYNKGETLNFVRDGIILADFGSTRRFVDLLRWTQ